MKCCVLASGSKGNVSYISTNQTKILIDVGMSATYIANSLEELHVDPSQIDAIILTHTHSDHINGLRVFLKRYHPTLYLTKKMFLDVKDILVLGEYYIIDGDFSIQDIEITSIKTSHDASDSNGYILKNGNKSIVYITDTGYIHVKHHPLLQNHNYYIMESNHDVRMLMDGKYPYHLKQRIVGDRGHLSNKASADYLSNFIGENTEGVILIHLSAENNDPEVAVQTLTEVLTEHHQELNKIIVSKQNQATELIEV